MSLLGQDADVSFFTGNMIPTQRDSRFCFPLLLALLGLVISFHGGAGQLTRTQWFEVQHINMTNRQCNIAMQPINQRIFQRTGACKRLNTFLHTTYATVANVCTTPNVTCPSSNYTNCHNSSVQVTVTNCNLTRPSSTSYRNCQYSQNQAQKIYIVACDCRDRRDSPTYMQVPVHLDWLI